MCLFLGTMQMRLTQIGIDWGATVVPNAYASMGDTLRCSGSFPVKEGMTSLMGMLTMIPTGAPTLVN